MHTSMALPGFDLPPSPAVTAIEAALASEFPAKARRFVLTHLRRHGPTSGEDLTDAMAEGGLRHPGSDKGVGGIYRGMHAAELIEPYADGNRRKGNGTRGATIWRITAKGLKA
jgi:hypothetical protein